MTERSQRTVFHKFFISDIKLGGLFKGMIQDTTHNINGADFQLYNIGFTDNMDNITN